MSYVNFETLDAIRREQDDRLQRAQQRMENDPAMGKLIRQRQEAEQRQEQDNQRVQAALETIRNNRK